MSIDKQESRRQAVLSLLDEVDRLRTEVDRLRGRFTYWKHRAKSAEGHLWAGDRVKVYEVLKDLKDKSGGKVSVEQAVIMVLGAIDECRRKRMPADHQETVWCACGDGYPSHSYGAGFMPAAGECENCAAAGSETTHNQGSSAPRHETAQCKNVARNEARKEEAQ